MSRVQVEMFGKLRARPAVLGTVESRKAQELLCYLLVHRTRPQSREQLATMLWPGSSPDRTRKYLRQALWQLQVASEDAVPDGPRLVTSDGSWVQLNPAADIELDVAHFEQAHSLCGGLEGDDPDLCRVVEIDRAIDLYRGDLLEGWYQDWCLYERERLQSMLLAMLDKLTQHWTRQGDYEAAEAYGLRCLRHDRARERTHRQLMQIYYLAGERAAALRQFQSCLEILEDEVGVRPSRRTVALYEQIRLEQFDVMPPSPSELVRDVRQNLRVAGPAGDILERLRRIRRALDEIEDQVTQDVRAAETGFRSRQVADPGEVLGTVREEVTLDDV